MTLYNNVDGKRVKMTPNEEARVRLEWEENASRPRVIKDDPDLEGALRLIALGHPNKNAIEALLNRKK